MRDGDLDEGPTALRATGRDGLGNLWGREMAPRSEALKQDLLEKIHGLIEKRQSGDKAVCARNFVDHFYRYAPVHDMAELEIEDLYGAAISMWNYGRKRAPGEAKIRVYNPRFEEHGWHSTHTVIEIVNDDMPFLVDSVTMELARQDTTVHLVIHPVFGVERDAAGAAVDFPLAAKRPKDLPNESFMHVEIDEETSAEALAEIEAGLRHVLQDVRACVEDWRPMRAHAQAIAKDLKVSPPVHMDKKAVAEMAAFVQWLHDDHFTFMGYREAAYKGSGATAKMQMIEGAGLGVLRDPARAVFEGLRDLGKSPPAVQEAMLQPELIRVTKANNRSTVHRRVHMDTIAVRKFNAKGKPIGEHLFVGLLTSSAYNQSPREIPFLRRKVDAVMTRSGHRPHSHSGKALTHILETYPRDELFQIDEALLSEIAAGIHNLQERARISVFLRPDMFQRYISAIVYVPRDRFSSSLRERLGEILAKSFAGAIAAYYTFMTDEVLSRVLFIVKTTPGAVPAYDQRQIEARLRDAGRTWADKLRQALVESLGEERGLDLFRRYKGAFPVSYCDRFNVQTALFDINQIEAARKDGQIRVNLYHPIEAEPHQLRFKLYHVGGPVVLSTVMPMMENMGVKVMEEQPFQVTPSDEADGGTGSAGSVYIHDFGLETLDGRGVDPTVVREPFHESFARTWTGEIENDGFNQLVLFGGLSWQDVVVLRAYSKYLRQASIPFSQDYMEQTLSKNAGLTRSLAALFRTRFDPDFEGDRDGREGEITAEIEAALDAVDNLDEDRIIRRFLNIVQSTLRTNFYQLDADGCAKPALSLKFDARNIDELPQPAPLREIFVYAPRFEAVHLRFGMVARGGLRWSDRREDFRTEVLGLVKAQQVKNAVIVPVGSKGGFVLKRPPPMSDRAAFMEEGVACYKTFIGSMLDITDNLSGDEIIAPKRVVAKDAADPYLVVAADKGTATFSDYANAVSVQRCHWLGDAFASGGSAGYDHKKMGITARGAWESVKRHFREMGVNTQSEDFTVVGVGDMGGDVFGNGMLLSEHIRLVAAFNHLHIFVDPNPDAAKSFAERKRLFDAVKGWGDYDQSLLSKGGAIFERKQKSLPLSPEIQKITGLTEDAVAPTVLINALLKAQVDLLWFGGIGTYVKHSDESHAEAGDRANDAVRVNGDELGCKVLGEGANLGITQRGRIEFASRGGRCNTDAIDNSAGVDCSDHEVNIKILLGDVVARGDMTEKQRNKLLEQMTDAVAEHVLRDNYQQTQSISVTESRASGVLDRHQRLMRAMERGGALDRALEFLPDDEEIADRLQARKGLTRPELSVLLAYAKNISYQELLDSDLPDDPQLSIDLERYFPPVLIKRFPDSVANHRLRREIIATSVTNSMINRTGPSFVNELKIRTGLSAPDIARAYTIVREVFDLRALWARIEGLDSQADSAAQTAMLHETSRTIERMTEWFLRNGEHPLDIAGNVETYKCGVDILAPALGEVLGDHAHAALAKRSQRFRAEGVPDDLARAVGELKVLSSACDVVRLANATSQPVKDVGIVYSSLGGRFGLDWLRSSANKIPADTQWHRMALAAMIDDLWSLQSEITSRVLAAGGAQAGAVEAWTARRAEAVERVDLLLGELQQLPQLDLAMLAVVGRELRTLVA
ncbi:MAG: NAD-glutamate dehydrogenase [Alphaproteobacteria bacterium]|nr:NAD-glutamate dehydrogenase [Alphaproteobacteria bacterium]